MSSCPNEDLARKVEENRRSEIREKSRAFLKQVVMNLCIPEGQSGRYDLAFHINRAPIIAEVLREIAKELDNEAGNDSLPSP